MRVWMRHGVGFVDRGLYQFSLKCKQKYLLPFSLASKVDDSANNDDDDDDATV